MSGYYAKNPLEAPIDCDSRRERLERCEEEAGSWFVALTKPQLAEYNARMAAATRWRGSPRWERERVAALNAFEYSTTDAREVYEMAMRDLLLCGEISEVTGYAFDEVMLRQTMVAA
jgi:hypothetical protein